MAQLNNTNAEKWTIKEAQKFIDSVHAYVSDNRDCSSLTEALTELGQYDAVLIYLEKKFDKVVFQSVKKAKDIIKQRIIKKGLDNKYNPTMSIFILKNNHDMKDKSEVEKTVINDEPRINLNINGVDIDLKA